MESVQPKVRLDARTAGIAPIIPREPGEYKSARLIAWTAKTGTTPMSSSARDRAGRWVCVDVGVAVTEGVTAGVPEGVSVPDGLRVPLSDDPKLGV